MSGNEFIDRAAEYRRRAQGTPHEAEKRAWLMLAESWLLMFRIVERQGNGWVEPLISARMPQDLIREIDAWAKRADWSRSKAIRSLIEQALAHAKERRPLSKIAARKAAELADREIDRLGDQAANR
jgi:hypothetical protein